MTIDEAISHAEEVAEQNEISAITYKNCKEIKTNMYEKLTAEKAENECRECAAEHRQVAAWLTELKQWRRVYGVCPSYEMCIPECREGYNAQIAEYKRLLKAAINDIYKECTCNTWGCDICEHLRETCDYDDRFTWKHKAEALKLIGEEDENSYRHIC